MANDFSYPLVSLVIPIYAGGQRLLELISRCKAIRDGSTNAPAGLLHEIIFVCDEPIDNSESILCEVAQNEEWIRIVSLSRNSGQHLATAVGFLYSSGDWILTIDEDLQHPPELLTQIIIEALDKQLDLVYVRSTIKVHGSSFYRDFASVSSKAGMRLLSRDNYSIVSSFRLIRGEVARSIASSIDGRSYLDSALFAMTSARRRGIVLAPFTDVRIAGASGYSFNKLLRHYGRMIMSIEFSGLRMARGILFLVVLPTAMLMISLIVIGWYYRTWSFAPGWLSLFIVGLSMNIIFLVYALYSVKLLSSIFVRSNGAPPFLVINRELDCVHLACLRSHLN